MTEEILAPLLIAIVFFVAGWHARGVNDMRDVFAELWQLFRTRGKER